MRIIVFVISFYLFISQCVSQPIGDTWYFSYQSPSSFGYMKFDVINDTLIGSITYQIIEKTKEVYVWPGIYEVDTIGKEYISWGNDSVFRYSNGISHLLFNYDCSEGDTVQFSYPNPLSQTCDSIGYAVVDSIGVISILGDSKRWFSVSPLLESDIGISGKIIEGIGPVEFYFFPEYISCIADGNEGGDFRCILDSGQTIYSSGIVSNCDYINSIPEILTEFKAFPNPVNESFFISFFNEHEATENEILFVTNAIGNRFEIEYSMINCNEILINCKSLQTGLYILVIESQEKLINVPFVKL